jgi:murein DD-endopeptidase MepM/ murein hydrolase activator NlpD
MMSVLVGFICFLLILPLIFFLKLRSENLEPIAYSFRLPLDGNWIVSREFAEWNLEWCGYHLAEDVSRGSEAPVYAAADGIVRFAALAQLGYGYVVIVEHKLPPGDPAGEYVCTVYGHLRKEGLTSTRQVSKSELIGYLSGKPEHNNGVIHLHFGVRKGRYVQTVIDPRSGGWFYGGYTTIFEECNKDNPIHQQILSEWLNPTTDQFNGEGFINAHS